MPVKKPILPFLNAAGMCSDSRRKGPWVWLTVHAGIPALLLLSVWLFGPVRVNTLLMDMLPQPARSAAAVKADGMLSERNGREAVILAAAPDFESAKTGAALIHSAFENSPVAESLSLYFDSSVIEGFTEYLYNYRFVIAGKETLRLLETGHAEEIAQDALASVYGAFSLIPLDNIERDPFLLAERQMKTFLSASMIAGGNLGLKDEVLSAHIDGIWYVLIRMTLAPNAVSVSGGKNAVSEIYHTAAQARKTVPGLDFYFSGVPFHSYESSSGAQREISVIAVIALSLILALFIYIFRSPLPVILSVLCAVVSLGMATAAALLVFREVHIITFVFGTTLIGTCVDYSIHFFIHWKGNTALQNGYAIRSHISKSITMCFISTEICFCAFLLAPFLILKQFAVFSMIGLLSSFLSAYCLYPYITVPEVRNRRIPLFSGTLYRITRKFSIPAAGRIVLVASLAVCAIAFLFYNRQNLKIENDIRSFYTMSADLLESEKRAAQVLDHGSSFWYFIVSGSSVEETLQHEESLVLRLEEEAARGSLGSFLGTSLFVPSIKTQQKTRNAMKALLPLAPSQFEYLGFPPEYAEFFYDDFNAGRNYCLPENAPAQAGVSNLWIGEIDGNYYSCVLPLHASSESIFRSIAREFDFVHFINKAADIGRDLDTLTRTMVYFFLAAYLIITVLICIVYPWRDSLKICLIPFFLILSALVVLTMNKIPLGFFSIAGLLMVFGLGLDFIIYMTGKNNSEGLKLPLTPLAVVLSFLTTLLSFGALIFSSFAPVHIFGLTVCAGLSAAFITAMLLQAGSRFPDGQI